MRFFLNIEILLAHLLCIKTNNVPTPPLLIKQPPSEEIFVRPSDHQNKKHLILDCEALAEPPARYRWKKNGKSFDWYQYDDHITQTPESGTLAFSEFFDSDAGSYQCFAENKLGTATSNKVTVHFAHLDSFKITPPLTLNGTQGQPFKLKCDPPSGIPKPKVLWLMQYNESKMEVINTPRITSDPEGTLWFSYLKQKDATTDFVYACAADSRVAYDYKIGNKSHLNVLKSDVNEFEPSLQYTTKNSTGAQHGKNVELFCIFSGNPVPNITWSRNDSTIKYSDRIIQRKFGRSLLIKTVDFNDKGVYTCEATNGIGNNKTHSIDLDILVKPYFIEEPISVQKNVGDSIELRCVASGNPKPCMQWIYNGKLIDGIPSNSRKIIGPHGMLINNITKADTGNYGCKATNSLRYIYKDVYVNVIPLTSESIENLSNLEVFNGQNVTLECTLHSVVKWYFNDQEITNKRISILESGNLHIQNVNLGDTGKYKCRTENRLGVGTRMSHLVVKKNTHIVQKPYNITASVGSTIVFTCEAISKQDLDLQMIWLRNGEIIHFENETRFDRTLNNSLEISKIKDSDAGTYTCQAKTSLDEDIASATLTVETI